MKKSAKKNTSGTKRCLTRKYKEIMKGVDIPPKLDGSHPQGYFQIFSLYNNSKYETQTSCSFNHIKV